MYKAWGREPQHVAKPVCLSHNQRDMASSMLHVCRTCLDLGRNQQTQVDSNAERFEISVRERSKRCPYCSMIILALFLQIDSSARENVVSIEASFHVGRGVTIWSYGSRNGMKVKLELEIYCPRSWFLCAASGQDG